MSDPRNWTERDLDEYMRKFTVKGRAVKTQVDIAIRSSDLESAVKPKVKRPNESKDADPRFRIHVHSRRRRLTDPDGISAKAVIDGLVAGRILEDDSSTYVESVTYSQEKAEVDETVIEVWELSK